MIWTYFTGEDVDSEALGGMVSSGVALVDVCTVVEGAAVVAVAVVDSEGCGAGSAATSEDKLKMLANTNQERFRPITITYSVVC